MAPDNHRRVITIPYWWEPYIHSPSGKTLQLWIQYLGKRRPVSDFARKERAPSKDALRYISMNSGIPAERLRLVRRGG